MVEVPATAKSETGEVEPIPTLPPLVTLNMEVLEDELTSKGSTVPVPAMAITVLGVVELRPSLPVAVKFKMTEPVEEATLKISDEEPAG